MRALTTTLTVALVFTLLAAPAQAVIHLSFGLYSSNKPTAMVKQFRPDFFSLGTIKGRSLYDFPNELEAFISKTGKEFCF